MRNPTIYLCWVTPVSIVVLPFLSVKFNPTYQLGGQPQKQEEQKPKEVL